MGGASSGPGAGAGCAPTRPEDILLHEPTSGTTGGTKWIPYTEQLRREFMRAVNPWMASLYLRHPGLFFGTHYWIISPYTEVKCPTDGKRRGFAEDREYLGAFRCWLTQTLFPLPASLALERDHERHLRRTAEGLLAARDLGLVSVWHPSAFLRLLAYMRDHAGELAEGPRRAALAEGRYADLWPRLRLISCWDAAFARADADRLRALFPKVEVEGKGLLAALHFGTLSEAAEFTDALHKACVDASAQLYKVNCVPAVLFKPPVDSTEATLGALLSILDRVLAK